MSRPCALALAIGLGLGIASCTYFVALVLFDGARAAVVGIDAVLLLVALAVRQRSGPPHPAASRGRLSSHERVLAVAVLVAAAAAAISFLANTREAPHGDWDAWATWNLRARWLADTGAAWRDAFPKPTMHGDYPLLVPATVARLWVYGGTKAPAVPAGVAAAYGAALVLLLYAALATVRGRAQGLIGALCLLGTPVFLRVVPWQYADVPLAFNLLAVCALLALFDYDPVRGRAMAVWAGVAAGLLAWTKNEGMMLVLGVLVVRSVLLLARPGRRSIAWLAAGLLAPAAIVLYFKLMLAPPSRRFGPQGGTLWSQLVDLERYATILSIAARELVRGTVPLLLALGVYVLLLGRTRDQPARDSAVAVAAILGFGALGYGFAYLTSRAELTWIVSNSANRLLLQLWPSVLLAFLLSAASPSERAAAPAAPAGGRRPKIEPRRRRR
jgi:hypothetical protein